MERNFGGSRFGGGGINVPVKEGDELDVKIEAVGEKGDGLTKKDGFVLFVPNTKAGDNVRIRVTKVLKKVGFAEVIGKSEGAEEQPAGESEPAEESYDEETSEEQFDGEDSENFGDSEEEEN